MRPWRTKGRPLSAQPPPTASPHHIPPSPLPPHGAGHLQPSKWPLQAPHCSATSSPVQSPLPPGGLWKHSQDHVPALGLQPCRAFSLFLRTRCTSHPDLQGARRRPPLSARTWVPSACHTPRGRWGFSAQAVTSARCSSRPPTSSQLLAGF